MAGSLGDLMTRTQADDLTLTTTVEIGFVDFSVLAWRLSKPIEIYAFRFGRVFMRGSMFLFGLSMSFPVYELELT